MIYACVLSCRIPSPYAMKNPNVAFAANENNKYNFSTFSYDVPEYAPYNEINPKHEKKANST